MRVSGLQVDRADDGKAGVGRPLGKAPGYRETLFHMDGKLRPPFSDKSAPASIFSVGREDVSRRRGGPGGGGSGAHPARQQDVEGYFLSGAYAAPPSHAGARAKARLVAEAAERGRAAARAGARAGAQGAGPLFLRAAKLLLAPAAPMPPAPMPPAPPAAGSSAVEVSAEVGPTPVADSSAVEVSAEVGPTQGPVADSSEALPAAVLGSLVVGALAAAGETGASLIDITTQIHCAFLVSVVPYPALPGASAMDEDPGLPPVPSAAEAAAEGRATFLRAPSTTPTSAPLPTLPPVSAPVVPAPFVDPLHVKVAARAFCTLAAEHSPRSRLCLTRPCVLPVGRRRCSQAALVRLVTEGVVAVLPPQPAAAPGSRLPGPHDLPSWTGRPCSSSSLAAHVLSGGTGVHFTPSHHLRIRGARLGSFCPHCCCCHRCCCPRNRLRAAVTGHVGG